MRRGWENDANDDCSKIELINVPDRERPANFTRAAKLWNHHDSSRIGDVNDNGNTETTAPLTLLKDPGQFTVAADTKLNVNMNDAPLDERMMVILDEGDIRLKYGGTYFAYAVRTDTLDSDTVTVDTTAQFRNTNIEFRVSQGTKTKRLAPICNQSSTYTLNKASCLISPGATSGMGQNH